MALFPGEVIIGVECSKRGLMEPNLVIAIPPCTRLASPHPGGVDILQLIAFAPNVLITNPIVRFVPV